MRTVGFLLVCGAAIGLLAASSAFAASSSIDTITASAITAPDPFEQASAIGIEETVLGSQLLSTEVSITKGEEIGPSQPGGGGGGGGMKILYPNSWGDQASIITNGDDIGFILKAEAGYGVNNDDGKMTATKKPNLLTPMLGGSRIVSIEADGGKAFKKPLGPYGNGWPHSKPVGGTAGYRSIDTYI
jgi:hypothetical protein